jgi:hypothetical protein
MPVLVRILALATLPGGPGGKRRADLPAALCALSRCDTATLPRAGFRELSDDDVGAAVDYMQSRR